MMRVELCSLQDQSRTFSLEISPCVSQQRKEVRTSDKQLLWFSPLCSTVQKEPIATQKKYRRQFSSDDSTHNLRITEFSHDNSTKKESTIVYTVYCCVDDKISEVLRANHHKIRGQPPRWDMSVCIRHNYTLVNLYFSWLQVQIRSRSIDIFKKSLASIRGRNDIRGACILLQSEEQWRKKQQRDDINSRSA